MLLLLVGQVLCRVIGHSPDIGLIGVYVQELAPVLARVVCIWIEDQAEIGCSNGKPVPSRPFHPQDVGHGGVLAKEPGASPLLPLILGQVCSTSSS